jgi:transposase
VPRREPEVQRHEVESIDLVRVRDLLEELFIKGQREPLLDVVLALLQRSKAIIEGQAFEIAVLRKQLYGRRSEKVDPIAPDLFAQVVAAAATQAAIHSESSSSAAANDEAPIGPAPAATSSEAERDPVAAGPTGSLPPPPTGGGKGKPRPRKRTPLKPTRVEEIPVPADERPCPSCGGERTGLGHLKSIVVEYIPAVIEIIEYRREKLVCRPCDGEISSAPLPGEKVVEAARPGPKLLAELTVNKSVDGLPLNRTQRRFRRLGVDLPIQTLNRWEGFAYERIAPLERLLAQQVLASDVINLDDTGLRVRDRSVEGGVLKGHIWVFVGSKFDPGGDLRKTQKFISYLYAPTWEAKYPEEFLRECRAVLHGDAYAGYECIALPDGHAQPKNVLVGCAMHARRPFAFAHESGDPGAAFFVERFQRIYRTEAFAKEQALTAEQRLELRMQDSLPVLQEMRHRAEDLSPLPLLKVMRKGVGYLRNQWDKLVVPFQADGRLEIDNGEAERRLRRIGSGRRIWLFAGSAAAAQRIAGTLSVVASAEVVGLEPGRYLAEIFDEFGRRDRVSARALGELLPHRWLARHQAAQ